MEIETLTFIIETIILILLISNGFSNIKLFKRVFVLECTLLTIIKYNDDLTKNIEEGKKEEIDDNDVVAKVIASVPKKWN